MREPFPTIDSLAAAVSRRGLLRGAGIVAIGLAASGWPIRPVQAGTRSHGLSIFGDLKYPADFPHFDYVNTSAPQGGTFRFQPGYRYYNQNFNTFNTLNSYVMKGDAPPRMELCFDTLMVGAADEPDSVYGLLAESVEVSEDGNVYRFFLRPEARFHDGSPLTAADVVFSMTSLKENGHPLIAETLRTLVGAEAAGDHEVVLTYDGTQNIQTPLTVSVVVPVFSKAYYETRDLAASTTEAPLGSGPYKVGRFQVDRFIEYDRVDDYWGRDLPVRRGQDNFARLRIDFFRDRDAQFQAFVKGDIRFRQETSSKSWATAYTFPAVLDGRVVKLEFPPDKRAGIQGWFINTRHSKFADPRTRKALDYCFDWNWAKDNIFYGVYDRNTSFFGNSIYGASGPIPPEEEALLAPFRDRLSPEVFGEAYVPPVSDGSGRDRRLLGEASRLLREAGWENQGGALKNAAGETLTVEFLDDDPVFERIIGPYTQLLQLVGIQASHRIVDSSQYQRRIDSYDFDITGSAFSFSSTPIEGVDDFFGSRAADTPGGYNLSGVKNPVVDELIDRLSGVQTRDELVVLLRAIDRVLRAEHIWVPNWRSRAHLVAAWDMFGWPEVKPDYAFPVERVWWVDPAKAAALGINE